MKPNSKTNPQPELLSEAHEGTPLYGTFGSPNEAPTGNIEPVNKTKMTRPPAPGRTAQGATEAQVRAAYAKDDPRYAGGNVFDLHNEQTTL